MNWYKKATIFQKPSSDWFEKGAIFGYTRIDNLKSKSVFLKPEVAATWGQKNGITHEEVFGLMQQEIDVFTWIYDIGTKRLDGYGFDIIPKEIRSAVLAEVYSKI